MVKKILLISGILLIMAVSSYSEKSRTLSGKNEFSGVTQETKYSKGDKYYDELGLINSLAFYDEASKIKKAEYNYEEDKTGQRNFVKKIQIYDTNQKVVQVEYYFPDNIAEKKGYSRYIETYDAINGNLAEADYFYMDKFAKKEGYNKSVFVYVKGFIRQKEYYFIEEFAKKIGYYKRIDYFVYDTYANEKLTEKAYFDKDYKEIKRETEQ